MIDPKYHWRWEATLANGEVISQFDRHGRERSFLDVEAYNHSAKPPIQLRLIPQVPSLRPVIVPINHLKGETVRRYWQHTINAGTGQQVQLRHVIELCTNGLPTAYLILEPDGSSLLTSIDPDRIP